jgi:hypothetical protein
MGPWRPRLFVSPGWHFTTAALAVLAVAVVSHVQPVTSEAARDDAKLVTDLTPASSATRIVEERLPVGVLPPLNGPVPDGTLRRVWTSDVTPTPAMGALVQAAKADLAMRLGIDQSRIAMVSAETVDWPNASIGCPEPGRAYAQVLTPGYRIVLRVGSATYHYHASSSGAPFCCASPAPAAARPARQTP